MHVGIIHTIDCVLPTGENFSAVSKSASGRPLEPVMACRASWHLGTCSLANRNPWLAFSCSTLDVMVLLRALIRYTLALQTGDFYQQAAAFVVIGDKILYYP